MGDACAQNDELPPKDNFHLFLLVGQSNMAGRGEVAAQDTTPKVIPPRVFSMRIGLVPEIRRVCLLTTSTQLESKLVGSHKARTFHNTMLAGLKIPQACPAGLLCL